MAHISRLVQERRNVIANALELCFSYTNPSIYASGNVMCHNCFRWWFVARSAPEPVLIYSQFNTNKYWQISVEFESKYNENRSRKCCLQNVVHFVQASLWQMDMYIA